MVIFKNVIFQTLSTKQDIALKSVVSINGYVSIVQVI